MRMLFLSPNRQTRFRPAMPIGMHIVAEAVRHMGWEVSALDLCFSAEPIDDTVKRVREFQPDYIGISIRNLDFQSYLEPVFHLPEIKRLVFAVREAGCTAPVVLGGSGFSLAPKEIMRFLDVPYGIAGPGEWVLPKLLKNLAASQSPESCDGVLWMDDRRRIHFNDVPLQSSDCRYLSLDRRNMRFDRKYYETDWRTRASPITVAAEGVEGKRGCPKKCIYCTNSAIARTKLMLKPPAQVAEEIKQIISAGHAKRFEFTEGAFNLPLSHARAVVQQLKQHKIRFPWNCMFSPGGFDKQLIREMAETGCDLVEMGSESGCDIILDRLNKGFAFEHIRKAHREFCQNNIRIEHCIFIGSPGETAVTVRQSLERMDSLLEDPNTHLFINFGYRLFPKTRLAEIAYEQGLLDKGANLAFPHYYIAPGIIQDDALLEEVEHWAVRHPNCYLWWGLPGISLKERVKQVAVQHQLMHQIFLELGQEDGS